MTADKQAWWISWIIAWVITLVVIQIYLSAAPVKNIYLRSVTQLVCAPYVTTPGVAWSCKDAGTIGEWILRNGPP